MAFIAKHEIRFCVGRLPSQCFHDKVVKETCERQIPVAVIPNPLPGSDVRIICFGKYGKFENLAEQKHICALGPSMRPSPGSSPCVWPSIDVFGMKHVYAPVGMEKFLFYAGARRSYRTEKARWQRAESMFCRLHRKYG